jgi:ATP-dependent DNA ligase
LLDAKTGEVPTKGRKANRHAVQANPLPFDLSRLAGAKRAKAAPEISPQLAAAATHALVGADRLREIKFDGYRMLGHLSNGKARLRSRKDLDWTRKFTGPKTVSVNGEVTTATREVTTATRFVLAGRYCPALQCLWWPTS